MISNHRTGFVVAHKILSVATHHLDEYSYSHHASIDDWLLLQLEQRQKKWLTPASEDAVCEGTPWVEIVADGSLYDERRQQRVDGSRWLRISVGRCDHRWWLIWREQLRVKTMIVR